ncbi:hypothetical protein GCM10010440_67910 [Kitasatospora cinereorecta]
MRPGNPPRVRAVGPCGARVSPTYLVPQRQGGVPRTATTLLMSTTARLRDRKADVTRPAPTHSQSLRRNARKMNTHTIAVKATTAG